METKTTQQCEKLVGDTEELIKRTRLEKEELQASWNAAQADIQSATQLKEQVCAFLSACW